MITPITGRGEPGRCDIEIPIENIRDLIYELGDMVKKPRPQYRVRAGGEYLAVEGVIQEYDKRESLKKADRFNGTIEKVTH
jgi:hypothetical protein